MNENTNNAWVKLFHPSGAQVTLPLPLDSAQIEAVMSSLDALLQSGLSVSSPGTEPGESVEQIGHLVRRVKTNSDGTETPLIDLYGVRANYRLLGLYLNDPEQLAEFEHACGVHINDLPLYEGESPIERGKNPKTDKYVFALPQPVQILYRANPRWEGEGDKKNSKRLFVRWQGVGHASRQMGKQSPLTEAGKIPCPVGTTDHPEMRGLPLGQVAEMVSGRRLLQYLAGDQYQPDGNVAGQRAKEAARLLLESMPAEE